MNLNATDVLIAEDDDDDYLIFSHAIEELSFTIILRRADDGEILLRILDEKKPDILFLDILMPQKDGRQCLKEIRSNRKYDTLPIIMYTSFNDLKDIEFCYREGANFYTIKPSSFSELVTTLEKILSIQWRHSIYFPPLSQFVLNG